MGGWKVESVETALGSESCCLRERERSLRCSQPCLREREEGGGCSHTARVEAGGMRRVVSRGGYPASARMRENERIAAGA
jgi:hypothetical protein